MTETNELKALRAQIRARQLQGKKLKQAYARVQYLKKKGKKRAVRNLVAAVLAPTPKNIFLANFLTSQSRARIEELVADKIFHALKKELETES